MKKAYVLCFNHMDPIWNRGWKDHFRYAGSVRRPYSDIEDEQLRRWIEIVSHTECRYSIEQSVTVRMFLERNPDAAPLLKRLVGDGRIELMGGGETVIDYNMVCGESVVRNHLYSVKWYERTLGRRPAVAIATDTFGLSAQLPQVLRGLGYDALAIYSRVFPGARPVWRGLDGSLVYIAEMFNEKKLPRSGIGGDHYEASACCGGEGCPLCEGTGLDMSNRMPSAPGAFRWVLAVAAKGEDDEHLFTVAAEETIPELSRFASVQEEGRRLGVEVEFVTLEDLREKLDTPVYDALRAGNVADGDVDARPEGNPVCTGCYASRIELKKVNRELENLLLAGETFAAFAADHGMTYPRRKIERLWNDVAMIQFHDAITASHTDDCYDELMTLARTVRHGALQVYQDATEAIAARVSAPPVDGWEPFIVFNPLGWKVAGRVCELDVRIPRDREPGGVEVRDIDGRALNVVDLEVLANRFDRQARVRFVAPELPPVGYRVLHYRFTELSPRGEAVDARVIENEHYRVELTDRGLGVIVDKDVGEEILRAGAGDLVLEEDYGSPWETLIEPCWRGRANGSGPVSVTVRRARGFETAVVEGEFQDARAQLERHVHRLRWRQEVRLCRGVKAIEFRTEIDWDADNARVMLRFPLTFGTRDDEAAYEVPFGTLRRPRYNGEFGVHTKPNGDWPALNFVSCVNDEKGYTVSLFNRGLPCHRVRDGEILLTPLRSPRVPVYALDFGGARDAGRHVFECALASNAGGLKEGRVVQRGRELNAHIRGRAVNAHEGPLPPAHSFLANRSGNVVISAVKRAEDGDDLVVRAYEAYGEEADDALEGTGFGRVREVDLLEENEREAGDVRYRPFEIKTLRAGAAKKGAGTETAR